MMVRVVFIAAVFVFSLSTQAHALLGPDISLGIRFGLSGFTEDDAFGTGVELSSAPLVGVSLGVRQGPLGLELSADWMQADLEDNTTKIGELTTVPILITGQYHILPKISPVDPYLGLGIGFYINSFEAVDNALTDEVDPTVGFHLSAGVNVMVSTALALAVDARMSFAKTDITVGAVKDDLDLNAFLVTGGIKYFLPN